MNTFAILKNQWLTELKLSPSKRTTPVPCAFCQFGGNGDKSCACGGTRKKYSKFESCFSGLFLPFDPKGGAK